MAEINKIYEEFLSGLNAAKPQKYTPVDVSSYYNNAAGNYRTAMEAAYKQQEAQAQKRAEQIAREYEEKRRQTYVNARLDAIGNNEQNAALGLAGNVYKEPRSGYAETSRIAENVALRSDLNSANRAEQNAVDTLALQLMEAGYTKDMELAKWMADLAIQQAEAAANEAHFAYNAELDRYGVEKDYLEEALNAALQQQQNTVPASSGSTKKKKTVDSDFIKVNDTVSKKKAGSTGKKGGW